MNYANIPLSPEKDLCLERLINASPDKLFRAWTEPELMKEWFCPKPWRVTSAVLDLRPGGSNTIVMQGPNGEQMPNHGVYLELIKDRLIVFTDAFTEAWTPSDKPFFVGIISFTPEGGKTRYRAIARHWNADDCAAHEKMGFHEGWGKATDQLEELVKTL